MNEKYSASLKSRDTEDWFDLYIIRPLCYYLALGFAKFDIHPNTVTICSMIIGAASTAFFVSGSFYYSGWWGLLMNIFAILMLLMANIFDTIDGQLARMTGKTSRMGRILDGMAGFVWFIPIYLGLIYRFYQHHDIEFQWLGIADTQQNVLIATAIVFILGNISGFTGISGQQRLADYYIQVHLFFQKGEKGSELDTSKRQQEIYDAMTPETHSHAERVFQKSYIEYTRKQEQATPQFQRLMKALREKYGSASSIPDEVRQRFLSYSRPVAALNCLLTFDFRTLCLFLFCVSDIPACYFLFEIVGMGLLASYINHRHESFCRRLTESL
jgi:phosphatidylglycerophosphate synthase